MFTRKRAIIAGMTVLAAAITFAVGLVQFGTGSKQNSLPLQPPLPGPVAGYIPHSYPLGGPNSEMSAMQALGQALEQLPTGKIFLTLRKK